jgi:hypothetical protein
VVSVLPDRRFRGADGLVQMTGELSWSANGKYLASAAGTHVYIWDFANRELIAK